MNKIYGIYLIIVNLWVFVSSNKLALLAGTLRTFQRHACDGSSLPLSCPNNTSIDILHANYGDASLSEVMASRCPVTERRTVFPDTDGCTFSSLMYSTTQRVFELCHNKRQCDITVKASTFTEEEPCPHHAKYLEVAFKCRPAIFINKIICEDEVLLLNCGPQSKIAIYSVFFGRTKDGSLECPQTKDVSEGDCQASFAYEIVMKKCHGFHACEIKASPSLFESPCPPHYHVYMKAVYACVPGSVLKSHYGNKDKKSISKTDHPQNDSKKNSTQEASKVSSEDLLNCTVTILSGSTSTEIGLLTYWMKAITFLNKNIHTFILYLVVGACVGALLCLVALVLHFWRDRNRERRSRIKHDPLTSTFSADFEDTEGEIDLIGSSHSYSPTPPQPPTETPRFYTSPRPTALPDSELILPRSLSRQNHQYLYS